MAASTWAMTASLRRKEFEINKIDVKRIKKNHLLFTIIGTGREQEFGMRGHYAVYAAAEAAAAGAIAARTDATHR